MNTGFANMASMAVANVADTAAEHSGGEQTLLDLTPTFVIVAISLLILYFVLNKLLFSRLTPFMEKRARGIEEALEEADKAKTYAESIRTEYALKIKQAHSEIEKMIEDAKSVATKESEAIIKNAKNESSQIIIKAKEEIEKERDRMIKDIKSEVASIALSAASKVIEANLSNEANKKLVEKFINEAGVA